jgi:ligand-binding sensor domain-containing protein
MKIFTSFLFLISTIFVYPQASGDWKTYANFKDLRDIAVSSQGIWAASSGGGFFYNFADKSYKTINRTDGLQGISLTAVTIDKQGKIWFGSAEGVIDVYDPETNSVRTILDIANSDRNSKQINELRASGDTIIVSSDFGISLINLNDHVFLDTFFKFGNFSTNITVSNTLKDKLIYASTESGIAIQKPGTINLSAPESWSTYTTSDGLLADSIIKIINYNGAIIAATKKGLSSFNGSRWSSLIPELNNTTIRDLLVQNDSLFILSNSNIWLYYQNSLTSIYSSGFPLRKLGMGSNNLYAASSQGIISIKDGSYLAPDGPPANQFPQLTVDNNGNLWSSSGKDGRGVGFYEFNGKNWKVYDKSNTPVIVNNDYYNIYAAPDNTIYAGSWGYGFLRVKGDKIDNFTTGNTDFKGTDQNPDFLVITGFGVDSKNNLWVLNSESVDKRTLEMLTPDSVWYPYTIPSAQNLFLQEHFNLVIDQYDTKWFCSQDPTRPGLYYFNENGTYKNSSDDKSGYINSSGVYYFTENGIFLNSTSGLNNNTVTSILVDKRGDIWVGTGLGVNIISNNGSILSTDPVLSISTVFTLRQQSINCMAVDPLNQKWIGTNQGLLLVNSDGTSLIASYDSKNSPLPSDIIKSIAIDENSGTVYVGTDENITSFKTAAIKPQDSFTELSVHPSPFILNGTDKQMTIEGLVSDSDIKILTITGKLIREIQSPSSLSPGGNRAFWDGKDMDGKYVASGIYLIIASDQEGNNTVAGKIAVIKE